MLAGSSRESVLTCNALEDLQELQSISSFAALYRVFGVTRWAGWVLVLCGDT